MKTRHFLWMAIVISMILIYGCGDSDDSEPPTLRETQLFSNAQMDGDISFGSPSTYTVSSAYTTGNILAGIDPVSGDEFRAFLNFPLGGSSGVPLDATIESAVIEIQVNSVTVPLTDAVVPIIMELMYFQPPTLLASDFNRAALLSLAPFIFYTSDAGQMVAIDVTPLMQEAQRQGLPDFQMRLSFDLDSEEESGLIEIDDDIENDATAPLLRVAYFKN